MKHETASPAGEAVFLRLGLWLADKGHQEAEEDGGGDAPGGGSGAAGEGADQAVFGHRLFDALGQQMAEAGEGDRTPTPLRITPAVT